jgi:hypothetical protein
VRGQNADALNLTTVAQRKPASEATSNPELSRWQLLRVLRSTPSHVARLLHWLRSCLRQFVAAATGRRRHSDLPSASARQRVRTPRPSQNLLQAPLADLVPMIKLIQGIRDGASLIPVFEPRCATRCGFISYGRLPRWYGHSGATAAGILCSAVNGKPVTIEVAP